ACIDNALARVEGTDIQDQRAAGLRYDERSRDTARVALVIHGLRDELPAVEFIDRVAACSGPVVHMHARISHSVVDAWVGATAISVRVATCLTIQKIDSCLMEPSYLPAHIVATRPPVLSADQTT